MEYIRGCFFVADLLQNYLTAEDAKKREGIDKKAYCFFAPFGVYNFTKRLARLCSVISNRPTA
jgi:hypothetical protein